MKRFLICSLYTFLTGCLLNLICLEFSEAHPTPVENNSTVNTGKLFIIGGGHRSDVLIDSMIAYSNLSEDNFAVVLPMASSVPDTAAYYGKLQFIDRGFEATAFKFEDGEEAISSQLDSLRNAALIYIPGGVQSRFMKVIEQNPGIGKAIKDAYKNGALIAGTSAGAAVMSKIMITGDQKKYPEYTSTFYHLEKDNLITDEGLGLIKDVIIDQHFVKRARNNRLLTAVMEYPDKVGIGIDESTAVVVSGNNATVVGESQVLVYRNKSQQTYVKTESWPHQIFRYQFMCREIGF